MNILNLLKVLFVSGVVLCDSFTFSYAQEAPVSRMVMSYSDKI